MSTSTDVVPTGRPDDSNTDLVTRLGGMMIPEALSTAYPALDVHSDALDAVLENMGGDFEDIPLEKMPRIKFPTGGDTLFNVPDASNENGVRQVREIKCIVVANRPRRAFWPSVKLTGDRPSCFSLDGKLGAGDFGPQSRRNPTGKCRKCPMAEFGTKAMLEGALPDARGQACKASRQLYMLVDRSVLPYQFQAPPTSLKPLEDYLLGLATQGIKFHAIEMSLRLSRVDGENPYAVLEVSTSRVLASEEAAVTAVYANGMARMLETSGVDDLTREMHEAEGVDPQSGEDTGGIGFGSGSEDAAAEGFDDVNAAEEEEFSGAAAGAASKASSSRTAAKG